MRTSRTQIPRLLPGAQRSVFGALFRLWLLLGLTAQGQAQTEATLPAEARIEYFGADRGYAVGAQEVILLCIVRNVGDTPLPENALRLRCYAVAGLDYTSGDLTPALPALAAGQAVAYRWRLVPSERSGPMVVAALLERSSAIAGRAGGPRVVPNASQDATPTPQTSLTVIPRFGAPPRASAIPLKPGDPPLAGGNNQAAWVGNHLVQARILSAERRLPALALLGRSGAEWRQLALATPLFEVRAAEEGQLPWWETFRWRDMRTEQDQNKATLRLRGDVGTRWGAEFTLTSLRDTGALTGTLRLTARRNLRLYGLRLPRLLAEAEPSNVPPAKANGSVYLLPGTETKLPPNVMVAATRYQGITFGLSWPSAGPFAEWKARRSLGGDPLFAPILSGEWESDSRGNIVLAGATLEFSLKLFAIGPSETLLDALRFQFP